MSVSHTRVARVTFRSAVLLAGVSCGGPSEPPSAVVATVTISSSSGTELPLGETVQLSATVTDAAGRALTDRPVTWSTLDPPRATVNQSGMVTGRGAGAVVIVAQSEGVSGELALTVFLDEPHITYLVGLGMVFGRTLYRARADGSDSVRLQHDATAPFYRLRPSPSGDWILMNLREPGFGTGPTYRMTGTGMDFQQLDGPGADPVWSPDGMRLAWLAREYAGTQIVLSDIAGGSHDTVGLAETVTWAPDGRRLAITYRPANIDQEIGVIDLDAATRARVNVSNQPDVDDAFPSWSPDGQWVAFWSNRAGNPGGLYLMRSNGAEARRLLDGLMLRPAAWSPDGRRLAVFTADAQFTETLKVVSVDGGAADTLPLPSGQVLSVAWSPRRNSLLVVGRQSGADQPGLFYVPADSLRVLMIPTPDSVQVTDAQWLGR